MKWNNWIRQSHRWLSIAFTVLVIVNIVLNILPLEQETLVLSLGYLTLLPLFLLLFTGLYLFVLPYAAKRRSS